MNSYIEGKIYGLPKPSRKGHNTSPTKRRIGAEYIHKVQIGDYKYFKVHMSRGGISKIKYFKKRKQAKLFVEFLRENRYL
jgi:hypothetical protein